MSSTGNRSHGGQKRNHEPHGSRRPGGIRRFAHLWYTYGADETERFKRILIAIGALIALAAGSAILTGVVSFAIPNHQAVADGIASRFRPRDFSYVMTILTSWSRSSVVACWV